MAAIISNGLAPIAAPTGNRIGATIALIPQREPVAKHNEDTKIKKQ